jgi:class 3 adenylate cyclase/tetratricopeptide (TPR) repeat protein
MICPACARDNPPGQKFCGECGARLASVCGGCGATNPPGQKFCGECGRPLGGPAPAAPSARAEAASRFDAPDAYTPRHLAERILTSKAALEGERKQVTVLFADMKGSMELLADRDPEEARGILDPVLQRMMEGVHRYEGTVNQVMGDGIMALFGAPLAHEDHAVRACYAALRMQDAIRRYTDEVRRAHGIEIQIRVGLNSGDVVVRSIGSDLRMDYTAVGQTTHLAARMEQLAPAGTIRLTADTVRLAEGFVQVTPLGPIPVKGVAEPVEVFELTGASAIRTRLQAARARGLSRFVGRDAEIEQMRQAADQARRGRGQVVAVVGEPGVGKSRLFHEFLQSHHIHGWLVLEASSVSYGKATPFLPLADLLRGYFRIDDRDDTRGVRAKVTGTLLTLDRNLEDAVPAVLWLLDALPPEDPFLGVDPAVRRQRAIDGAKRLLLRESHVQPLLVVFEDLHWLDAETQQVLDSLVDGLPTASILLAVNYRPEYRHTWGNKTYYRQLRIDPLAPESADELLQALIGDDVSVEPLKRLLIERTEGNPLFLEESVRTLVETRVLVGEPGAYRLARPLDTIQMPATVQAILSARIDRLPPELKRLLQAAAVVGKDVPVSVLESIADLQGDDLRRALTELQTAEFLYETRLFPDLEYTFKHALTHETAYGSVLHDRRRTLHAAIAEAIEARYADRLGEHVEVLAHHAARGGLSAKAVRYLRQAGEKSMGRSASLEAIAFFESARELLARMPETEETLSDSLDLHIVLGAALITVKGAAAPEVHGVYARAYELVERLGDTSRRFPVLWGLWFIHYTMGRYEAAREAGRGLLEDALAGDDSGRLVEAHHALWPTLLAMGETAAAVPHMERGIALYDKARHASQASLYAGHDPGVCCRYQLSVTRWLLGSPDAAVAVLRDALRLSDELRHAQTTTVTLWFATALHLLRGEREAAAETAERLIAIADAHGFEPWKDIALLARPARPGADLDASILSEVRGRLLGIRSAAWRRVFCLCFLAELCLEAGCPEVGRFTLAAMREEDRTAVLAPEILRLEGELHLQGPPPAPDAAERCFRGAIELARHRTEKSLELRATISLARLLAARGEADEARRMLAAIHGWFTEGLGTRDLREATALLEKLEA